MKGPYTNAKHKEIQAILDQVNRTIRDLDRDAAGATPEELKKIADLKELYPLVVDLHNAAAALFRLKQQRQHNQRRSH